MKANLKHIRKSRVYSVELNRRIVPSFEQGSFCGQFIKRLRGVREKII